MTKITVNVWHGTTQETHTATTYRGAMRIVSSRHSNSYSPTFFENDTGEQLHDDGNGLVREDGVYVA